jgi:GMP synthase (glutamine-hydrolysing)
MARPRLALLNAAVEDEHTTRNFRRELAADLAEFHLPSGDLPAHTDFDGFVVTGSKTSVYDDEDWIAEAEAWVRDAVDDGLPALGVCWGHQLLAQALGGTVEAMDEFEIGYREVRRVGESDLLADVDDPFTVFVTHGDAVTELPPDATPIAENEYGNHGFQVGDVHTVQFHPEYDQETARDVTAGKTFLGADRIETVLADVTDENYAAACHAKRLFDNFVATVEDRRGSPSGDETAA